LEAGAIGGVKGTNRKKGGVPGDWGEKGERKRKRGGKRSLMG